MSHRKAWGIAALFAFILLLMWLQHVPLFGTNTPARVLTPERIARYAGAAYGDAHPRISGVRADVTEGPPFHPMYFLTLLGHFHKGHLSASQLGISANADRMNVWSIRAFNGSQLVWEDGQLPAESGFGAASH